MKVKYQVFKDYKMNVAAQSDEEKLSLISPEEAALARERMYSFVCLCHDRKRKLLFLGATHRNGDILIEYDLASGAFRSCGFAQSDLRGPNDVKIHKGLALDPDGEALYFGIATLSPLAMTMDAPGGAIIRYEIASRKFTCLGRPIPGDFIQATSFDFGRGLAYLYTDRGNFAIFDLKERKLVRQEAMQSAPHNGCIDNEGGAWGTHTPGYQGFFRYNPERKAFEFPKEALPHAAKAANVMYSGAGPVDSILNGGDGFLYLGTALGDFYRLDPRQGTLKFLGKPFPDVRLPGLALGGDGWLYLSGGATHTSMLARYHRTEERFEYLGPVQHSDGTFLHYAHELAVIDGKVYIGETDNQSRSGYLWICEP